MTSISLQWCKEIKEVINMANRCSFCDWVDHGEPPEGYHIVFIGDSLVETCPVCSDKPLFTNSKTGETLSMNELRKRKIIVPA